VVCKPFEEGEYNTKAPEIAVEISSSSTAKYYRTQNMTCTKTGSTVLYSG
jgi:hypothetical protein